MSKSIFYNRFKIMRESRLIFENLKVKKELYNFFNCFKESTIINDFNNFFHFEFVLDFDLFEIFTLIEFVFLLTVTLLIKCNRKI